LRRLACFPTYIVTDGSKANLVTEFDKFFTDLLSLTVGEVDGVSDGGRGKESRLTDSESEVDDKTLFGR
jgi:hypothetical protein